MDLKNRRVVVMGLGRFGGGVGVTRFLVQQQARILVTDQLTSDKLSQSLEKLQGLPVEYRLGEHLESDFASADLIVVNPAVDPRQNPYLQAAHRAGVATTSEIRLLVSHLPNRKKCIGITGSAGKSTTTAMIGHILKKARGEDRVHIGGNLGGSLLGRLPDIGASDWVVLELSSFMLQDMADDGWSPHVAVVTNLQPNHLDRHGTLREYAQAKQAILRHQQAGDVAILGDDLPMVLRPEPGVHAIRLAGRRFSSPDDGRINLLLPGDHNQVNAWMAIEAAHVAGVGFRQAAQALGDFPGLPHRMQFVCQSDGVKYYNDSKATTPSATLLALRSFLPKQAHVILGGYDKGSDFSELAAFAATHAAGIYTIGVTGDRIADLALAAASDAAVVRCGTLDQAVSAILPQTRRGQVVLLSTACASWDQFDNYEQRGSTFIQLVLTRTGQPQAI